MERDEGSAVGGAQRAAASRGRPVLVQECAVAQDPRERVVDAGPGVEAGRRVQPGQFSSPGGQAGAMSSPTPCLRAAQAA